MNRITRRTLMAAAAVIVSTLSASAEDALKVTIGQRGNWDTAIAQLGTKAGIFKKHGIALEMVYTAGSGDRMMVVLGLCV